MAITITLRLMALLTSLCGEDSLVTRLTSSLRAELELESFLQCGAWCFTPLAAWEHRWPEDREEIIQTERYINNTQSARFLFVKS